MILASPEQLLIEKEKFKEFKEQLWNKLSNMEKKSATIVSGRK